MAGSLAGMSGFDQSCWTSVAGPAASWQVKHIGDCGSSCRSSIGPCASWVAWHEAHVSEASPDTTWGEAWEVAAANGCTNA